jgi:hypothetical protein
VAAHSRIIGPMNEAPRCGARTRAGTPCQSPAISGKARCRMHGGKKSGAPRGNRNAVRHGVFTEEAIEREVRVRELCLRLRALTSRIQLASTAEPPLSTEESGQ